MVLTAQCTQCPYTATLIQFAPPPSLTYSTSSSASPPTPAGIEGLSTKISQRLRSLTAQLSPKIHLLPYHHLKNVYIRMDDPDLPAFYFGPLINPIPPRGMTAKNALLVCACSSPHSPNSFSTSVHLSPYHHLKNVYIHTAKIYVLPSLLSMPTSNIVSEMSTHSFQDLLSRVLERWLGSPKWLQSNVWSHYDSRAGMIYHSFKAAFADLTTSTPPQCPPFPQGCL